MLYIAQLTHDPNTIETQKCPSIGEVAEKQTQTYKSLLEDLY